MEEMQVGNWKFKVSKEEKVLSEKHILQALDNLHEWRKSFLSENTWVQKELGVPSILVRLDCVPQGDVLSIFEIEERPSVGLGMMVNQLFSVRMKAFMQLWPRFFSVVSDKRGVHDDPVWVPTISMDQAKQNNELLIIRAEPEEKQFHELAHRSVSTVVTKGHKEYGLKLGLWSKIRLADFDSLPWDQGFCIKPLQGSKTHDVEIWHPKMQQYKKKGIHGVSTRSRIKRTLESKGEMYCQPLIHPLNISLGGKEMLFAYRVFFGYNPKSQSYQYLGGFWNARPSMMIHGASDAIFGPVN